MAGGAEKQTSLDLHFPKGKKLYDFLVVDDDSVLLDLISRKLKRVIDCSVEVASNFEEGLKLIKNKNFDVAILDFSLGINQEDGIELLKKSKIVESHRPAVLITGVQDPQVFQNAKDAGFTKSLLKAEKFFEELEFTLKQLLVEVNK